jgi:hypothetical protein
VARQRESRPSSRRATARVRARPRTITTASTTPSRGSQMLVEPIENDGRVMGAERARRALVLSTTLFRRWLYTSSLTHRASCSRSRAPASTSITHRVRFSSNGAGSGSDEVEAGCWPKKSSESNRARDARSIDDTGCSSRDGSGIGGAGNADGIWDPKVLFGERLALPRGPGLSHEIRHRPVRPRPNGGAVENFQPLGAPDIRTAQIWPKVATNFF